MISVSYLQALAKIRVRLDQQWWCLVVHGYHKYYLFTYLLNVSNDCFPKSSISEDLEEELSIDL